MEPECASRNCPCHSILQQVPMLLFYKKIHGSFQQTAAWMCFETSPDDCFFQKRRVFLNVARQIFRKENIPFVL